MGNLLSEVAFWLARRALKRAERSSNKWERQAHVARSQFWTDVECWLSGLGSWRDIRDRRRLQTGKG